MYLFTAQYLYNKKHVFERKYIMKGKTCNMCHSGGQDTDFYFKVYSKHMKETKKILIKI